MTRWQKTIWSLAVCQGVEFIPDLSPPFATQWMRRTVHPKWLLDGVWSSALVVKVIVNTCSCPFLRSGQRRQIKKYSWCLSLCLSKWAAENNNKKVASIHPETFLPLWPDSSLMECRKKLRIHFVSLKIHTSMSVFNCWALMSSKTPTGLFMRA